MATLIGVEVSGRRLGPVDHVVAAVFAGEGAPESLGARDREAVDRLLNRRGWRAEEGRTVRGELRAGVALSIHGLGPRAAFDERKLKKLVELAAGEAETAAARRLALVLPDHDAARGEPGGLRVARDLALAGYRFDGFRSERKKTTLRAAALLPPAGEAAAFRTGVEVGRAVAAGMAITRDLGNTPPNEATPAWMAGRARELARELGARVDVLGPPELKRRKMGGILAVGGGSSHPPRLVRIELGRGEKTIALVGKGVTFDTGGISIKPAAQMDEMKWDKSGACTVLGVLAAVAELKLPVRIRAYLPLAENMPDGAAYRPGDIVRISNGKTVEILNTDAEGRMILADALAWASSERPDALVEYSTLTGACVVALGPTGAGLFTPDDGLAAELLDAAGRTGERLWRLPLWGEFLDEMRGAHADLKNSGGRWGGASTAAAFLSQFVGPLARWAHVDIAGPAYVGEGRERRGSTGYGVGLTVDWLRRIAGTSRR